MPEPGVEPDDEPAADAKDESSGGGCCGACCKAENVDDQPPISVAPGENYVLKHERCITDPHMLLLFLVFWGLLIAVIAHSYDQGNVNLILYGYDWKVRCYLATQTHAGRVSSVSIEA